MNKSIADLKTRLYLSSVLILAFGVCGAILIHLTAVDGPNTVEGYVIANGVAYPIELTHSEAYVHELQRFGGKAAVVFDEFHRWFAALCQGKSLAISVAWISVFLSLGVFLFANYLPSDAKPDNRDEDDRDETR